MCKALSMSIQAQDQTERRNKDKQECRFRKLLASRWQVELKREAKLKNNEETADPEKEKQSQLISEEEE